MIRLLIVEDKKSDSNTLTEYVSTFSKKNNMEIKADVYSSAEEYLSEGGEKKYHVAFLDIRLPGTDGLNLANTIRKNDKNIVIVFITNLAQFAIRGYEVEAKDFIVKPILYSDFERKFYKIIKSIKTNAEQLVTVKLSHERTEVFKMDELVYIEVFHHDVIFHTKYNDFKIIGSLSKIEEKFAALGMIRCSRCYMINPRHIKWIHDYTVNVDGHELFISRARYQGFISELNKWLGRNT